METYKKKKTFFSFFLLIITPAIAEVLEITMMREALIAIGSLPTARIVRLIGREGGAAAKAADRGAAGMS